MTFRTPESVHPFSESTDTEPDIRRRGKFIGITRPPAFENSDSTHCSFMFSLIKTSQKNRFFYLLFQWFSPMVR